MRCVIPRFYLKYARSLSNSPVLVEECDLVPVHDWMVASCGVNVHSHGDRARPAGEAPRVKYVGA